MCGDGVRQRNADRGMDGWVDHEFCEGHELNEMDEEEWGDLVGIGDCGGVGKWVGCGDE